MGETGPAIDFLHSRLAPPRQHRIPRWGYLAAGAVVLLIILAISAYSGLSAQEQMVADKNSQIAKEQSKADAARDFVNKETLAEYWRGGDPRYMACMRDLDAVIPEDGQTYATSLDIKAQTPSLSSQGNLPAAAPAAGADDMRLLFVTLQGHTANLESVTALVDRMNRNPSVFKDPKTGPETKVPRTQEFLFSITFGYVPPKPAAQPAK